MDDNYYCIEKVLNPEECKDLIDTFEKTGELKNQEDMGDGMYQRYDFHDVKLADQVWNRIRDAVIGMDPECVEISHRWYVSKYWPDYGYMNEHIDGNVFRNGKISKYTIVIYLNEDFGRGETYFPDTDNYVVPFTGRALVLAQDVTHRGEKVFEGVKYILRSDILVADNEHKENIGNV